MENHVREVKKVAEKLMEDGEIESFKFGRDRRHHLIEFQVRGKWMSVPVAVSPRTPYSANYARQQIRRRIRAMSLRLLECKKEKTELWKSEAPRTASCEHLACC